MKYIAAVDQSTSASKAFLVDASGAIVRRASKAHRQFYPAPGRVEHDAQEIFENVTALVGEVTAGIAPADIAALAITNQRETTVVWDAATGEPVAPAIVWQDVRGEALCAALSGSASAVERTTGLGLSPYYSAAKLAALFAERPELAARARSGQLRAGTVDSYLAYRLTGNHFTDVTNASRTQLMDLAGLDWSADMLRLFGIAPSLLPERILPSDGDFGTYRGMAVTGVLGDSHASLFGLGCHAPGTAKTSYGTGSSVMMNVGERPVFSGGGLTSSVAYGFGGKTFYNMEGNITCSGDTLVWLCKGLELFRDADEIERLARTVPDSLGVTLVPALSGLGAPRFDTAAKGVLCGLTRGATRAHVARAGLEAIVHQISDVLDVMRSASGYDLVRLMADGGGTKNTLMMQMQADMAGCAVECSAASEISALGAAYMAGLRQGVFSSFGSIPARAQAGQTYLPAPDGGSRAEARRAWALAVEKALSH